jgi:hypothetical protein
MLLTDAVHEFREVIRHIWNSYLRIGADWDTVEEFRTISIALFEERVIRVSGINARPIPLDYGTDPLAEYRLFANHAGKLSLYPNRDIPASGYWDYQLEWIPPEKNHVIQPICLFDFDVRGWRMIQYYRARIIQSDSNPELNGRDALIDCAHVQIEVKNNEQVLGSDLSNSAD